MLVNISYRFILLKEVNFKLSDYSPLIIDRSKKIITFAPLNLSKLIYTIGHFDTLRLSYLMIKSNLGNLIYEANKEILDNISVHWFNKVSNQIQNNSYRFGFVRHILIPKIGRFTMQSIIIMSPYEKIVQKAVFLIIQEMFEPLDNSYGFRSNYNYLTALKSLNYTFYKSKWIIKINLIRCLDNIFHDKFFTLLACLVTCIKTYNLIKSSLNNIAYASAFLHKVNRLFYNQLFLMLTNIYLYKFDLFSKEINVMIMKDVGITFQLNCVRYINVFIASITSSLYITQNIIREIVNFLNLILYYKVDKNKVKLINPNDGVYFLNTILLNRKIKRNNVTLVNLAYIASFVTNIRICLGYQIPTQKLLDRLIHCGYLRWSNTLNCIIPTAMRFAVNLDHYNILSLYNYIIYGLIYYYYSLTNNLNSLINIVNGLKMSCVLTLAFKYKLNTIAKTFRVFGIKLTCPRFKIEIYSL